MKFTSEDLNWAPLGDLLSLYGKVTVGEHDFVGRIRPWGATGQLHRWTATQIGSANASFSELGEGTEGTISDAQAAVVRTINDRLACLHPEDDE